MTHTLPPVHMRRNGFDPVPELAAIRDHAGVQSVVGALGNTVYLVTRHEDVKAVLADHEHFSNSRPPGFTLPGAPEMSSEELAKARAGNLLGLDPPEHQRLRRLLTPEFTIRRMKRLEPRIAEIVEAHLDAMAAGGAPADLVSEFALPVPSLVICELLGVPYDDRDDFQHRSARQLDLSLPIAERMELQQQSRSYMHSLVRQARRTPGEDILGMLIREHGDSLSDDELVGIAGLLLLAGHETTSNMLGSGHLPCCAGPTSWPWCAMTRMPSVPRSRNCCAGCRWCTTPFRGSPPPTWKCPAWSSRPVRWSSRRCPRVTATRPSSTGPTSSTCGGAHPGTSPSDTVCTTASGRRWPGWRCGSRSPHC